MPARDDLQASYRRLGAILLEEDPAEALACFRKAFAIAQSLSDMSLSNVNNRRDLASGRLAIGEALHRLGKHKEALEHLMAALDATKQLVSAAPNQIYWVESLARAHFSIAKVLLDLHNDAEALAHHQQGLAAAEKLVQSSPASLHFQRDRADAFELLGQYYAAMATRPDNPASLRSEWQRQARSWFEKSQAVWRDWTLRKVATPYAGQREARVETFVASLGKP